MKQVKRLIGFTQFFRSFIPKLNEKLLPFYKLLRKDADFTFTDEHFENFRQIKNDLLKATTTTLRLAKPNQQYVILCDASYHCSGFVLMIEDYLDNSQGGKQKHTHQFPSDPKHSTKRN